MYNIAQGMESMSYLHVSVVRKMIKYSSSLFLIATYIYV